MLVILSMFLRFLEPELETFPNFGVAGFSQVVPTSELFLKDPSPFPVYAETYHVARHWVTHLQSNTLDGFRISPAEFACSGQCNRCSRRPSNALLLRLRRSWPYRKRHLAFRFVWLGMFAFSKWACKLKHRLHVTQSRFVVWDFMFRKPWKEDSEIIEPT